MRADHLIQWSLGLAFFLITSVLLQGAYWVGYQGQQAERQQTFISQIEKRVALDLPKLKLATPQFATVTHTPSIIAYLNQFEQNLKLRHSPVQLIGIDQVFLIPQQASQRNLFTRVLQTNNQRIELTLQSTQPGALWRFSLTGLVLSGLMTFGLLRLTASGNKEEDIEDSKVEAVEEARIILNLHDKTLSNGIDDIRVCLPNKPFCFYAALLEYCLQHETPYLNHAKDVPDDVIGIANKYFYRLIELGHTKRRRPDFGTNLDKTLSEIRAALDEVFVQLPESKLEFYPPKAQGEGSRSRKHNYALEQLNPDHVEFIGK